MNDDQWMNDEYFCINMSVGEKFVVGALQDVERWSCSKTLHFSSQRVLMESEVPFKFEYNNRFYHPIFIKGACGDGHYIRNMALLSRCLSR